MPCAMAGDLFRLRRNNSSSSQKSFGTLQRRRASLQRLILTILLPILIIIVYLITAPFILQQLARASTFSLSASQQQNFTALKYDPAAWLRHLSTHPYTEREACRELTVNAQTCVYSGLVCFNTSQKYRSGLPKPIFLRNDKSHNTIIPSDNWCALRQNATDPKYNSASRYWPVSDKYFAAQQSCLLATFTNWKHLIGSDDEQSIQRFISKIRWEPHLRLVHFDYAAFNHNNHMLMDILWLLDISLFQDSLAIKRSPLSSFQDDLFGDDYKVYLPQSMTNFVRQTSKDLNRLLYAMVLRKNLTKLYPGRTPLDLKVETPLRRYTSPLHAAYPELNESLVFHSAIYGDPKTDLVCTPRLVAGAKLGNGGHERVCRYMRERGYELFGIEAQPMKKIGRVNFPQAPKRIMIVNRHLTRVLQNHEELTKALKEKFEPMNVTVEYASTSHMTTAEENVRMMARAGVVITPHGSHTMSLIWMPRNR